LGFWNPTPTAALPLEAWGAAAPTSRRGHHFKRLNAPVRLFDTHSHFHDAKFESDRAESLARAQSAGVELILTLGDSLAASRAAIALARANTGVLAAVGIHPSNARCWDDEVGAELERLLGEPEVVVLGEIGLDFYWDKSPEFLAIQDVAFRAQLRMARRLGYAVSIHSRESNDAVLAVLEEEQGSEIGGVLHCFNGTYEQARRGLDLGFHIGVGGTSTYPKAGEIRDVARKIGIDHLVVETDAPYLPPQPMRGKRNEPAFVADTTRALAATLGLDPDLVAERTFENGMRALKIPARRAHQ
jgi:TatD DNase family protein